MINLEDAVFEAQFKEFLFHEKSCSVLDIFNFSIFETISSTSKVSKRDKVHF